MELLGILAVLVVVGIPVSLIVLFVAQSGLRRRIDDLERRLAAAQRDLDRVQQAPPRPADPVAPTAQTPVSAALPSEAGTPPAAAAPDPAPPSPAPGPWQALREGVAATGPDTPVPDDADQNRPLVIRPDRLAALAGWLRDNWIYAVAGVSLALAGVFLVQWGAERGLLSPGLRVLAALALGGVLILGGEWLRRRHGDAAGSTAYLPSVFSGAGIVVLFAAITAARQLYGLIGPTPAFAGLFGVAALAVALGWRHGPLMVALGLLGATAAPFLIGAPPGPSDLLHPYFLLVAVIGLAVDAVRRWAWISVLALALSFAAGGLLQLSGSAGPDLWMLQVVLLALVAAALPDLSWRPVQDGITLTESLALVQGREWPGFPTRLAAGTLSTASVILALQPAGTGMPDLLAWMALAGLALAFTVWAAGARGMADLAGLPALAFGLRLIGQIETGAFTPAAWRATAEGLPPPDPLVWAVIALAALIAAGFAWRALRAADGARGHGVIWGLAAVTLPALVLVWLELTWRTGQPLLSPGLWAGVVMAHAAAATALALAFARCDGADRRRTAHAGLAALCLVALALFVMTTGGPLTLALAVLVAAAAGIDRRFDLPEFALFVLAGLAVLLFRLTVDPGIDHALHAPLPQVALAHAGAIAGIAVAWAALAPRNRHATRLALECAGATVVALTLAVAITRWLIRDGTDDALTTHWGLMLNALPWLALMLSQLYLMRPGARGNGARGALAGLAAFLALLAMLGALLAANPLTSPRNAILGPPVLDSILLAYALPGLALILAARAMPHLSTAIREALNWAGILPVGVYAVLEVRRFWRGPDLSVPGVTQPELYSYTVAMMATGAVLLWQSIARASPGLRRLAMAVIGLTAAKVFLIDGAGLTGLMRVAAFLGLGLTLAGLAWLNRWAAQASRQG